MLIGFTALTTFKPCGNQALTLPRFSVQEIKVLLTASDGVFLNLLSNKERGLMALGVAKTSSEDFVAFNALDKHYIDRFLRIIRNQPSTPSQ